MSRSMKETVANTLAWLQTQPKVNMQNWAKENPTEFYRIASKLLPREIIEHTPKEKKVQVFRIGGQEIRFN